MATPTDATIDQVRQLSEDELDQMSAGFKVDPNFKGSADVIDARGGSVSLLGYIVTWDQSGKVTSVTPPK